MSKFVVMGGCRAAAGVGDAAFDGIYKGWGHSCYFNQITSTEGISQLYQDQVRVLLKWPACNLKLH
jgi:hypothetical protein